MSTAWRAAFKDLHETLVAAQAERSQRQKWVDQPGGRELAWAVHERQVMTDRVNLLRARRGDDPISESDAARKEHMAMGHSDYTQKWALCCADLVIDGVPTGATAGATKPSQAAPGTNTRD